MTNDHYALALHQMVDGPGSDDLARGGENSETRSTLAAPDAFLDQWFAGNGTTTAGVIVNERTALTVAAVFQAVRILSEAAASLPVLVYQRLPGGGRDKNLAHPLFAILDQAPNDDMSAFTFRETMMGYVLLWGNAYAEIERDNAGRPIALNPIRPDRVKPRRNPVTKQLEYKIIQGGVIVSGDREVVIAKEDMFHIKGLSYDGLVGYSIVQMARQSWAVGMAAEASSAAFFGNGVRTQGYLKIPHALSEKAFNNLRNSFAEKHTGPFNSGKPILLEEGAEYVPIMMPLRDAQFLESREFQVEEVARWFNLPPHKLGKMERATNSNIEQQSIDFVVHSVRPWLIRFEAEMLLKLFSAVERETMYAEHNVDALLRGDIKSRYEAYSTAINNGFMLIDEAREIENRNPLAGGVGKTTLVSVNAQPLAVVAGVAKLAEQGILPMSGSSGTPGANINKNKGVSAPAAGETEPDKGGAGSAGSGDGDGNHAAADVRSIAANFRGLLISSADRVVRRETECLERAARKPGFGEYLPKFYEEHREYLRTQLEPVVETMALSANGDGERIRGRGKVMMSQYIDQSLGELRAAIEGSENAAEVARVIVPVLDKWKRERAVGVAMLFGE